MAQPSEPSPIMQSFPPELFVQIVSTCTFPSTGDSQGSCILNLLKLIREIKGYTRIVFVINYIPMVRMRPYIEFIKLD